MALTVPPPHIAYIKKFLELSDEQVEAFLRALREAGPQFNIYDLAHELSKVLQLSEDVVEGMLSVLVSLYRTRDLSEPESVETFVDREVYPSLTSAQVFATGVADAQWRKLRNAIVNALSHERTLGTTAKAGPVLTQHERIFVSARIMTDLRPIFHVEVSDEPDASVIVHMLKITQRDNFGNKTDLYFALDSNDIKSMKTLFERAEKKETTLKRMMKTSGVVVLDPKAIF